MKMLAKNHSLVGENMLVHFHLGCKHFAFNNQPNKEVTVRLSLSYYAARLRRSKNLLNKPGQIGSIVSIHVPVKCV